LNNLVSNALRYTSAGGEITLDATTDHRPPTTDHAGDHSVVGRQSSVVILRVRDTGSGIEAQDLPFIFDRFYRADQSRQRVDSNASGLGLAIAKAIVEAHGGTLAVESRPHVGTTFTITLPAAAHQADGGEHDLRDREMVDAHGG
jgi:signal transduction histidine kinase